uniref:Uncharacterized protein n=1 Tax=Anguilla anguilla TaxID=7936 RepID=A0A0E9U503_ANGAN
MVNSQTNKVHVFSCQCKTKKRIKTLMATGTVSSDFLFGPLTNNTKRGLY